MDRTLLELENLSVEFKTTGGTAKAVDRVSFHMMPGETLGLVGESGCGKTVTSLSLLGLIPSPPGSVQADRMTYNGKDLTGIDREALREIRGLEISMIFQEPMTSLNPVLPVGRQVAEPLMEHKGLSKTAAYKEAAVWLERVKIPAARQRMNDYPHQLSGGMRQRVMIAMAMICRPKLIIADEPTTALDVTIQAQILSLMQGLKDELDMSILLITHDMGVVAQMASRVIVMYAGEVVEEADVITLFDNPLHPYTQGLLKSIPRLSVGIQRTPDRLSEIKGTVPRLTETIQGCKFTSRCSYVFDHCRQRHPQLEKIHNGHWVRCWLMDNPEKGGTNA